MTPEAPAPNREIAPSQVTLKTVFTVSFGVLLVLALVMAAIHSLVAITLTSTAVLMAVALDHAVQWLVRRRFPRSLAIGVVTFAVLGLLTGFGFTLIPPAVDQGKALVQQAPAFIHTARQSQIVPAAGSTVSHRRPHRAGREGSAGDARGGGHADPHRARRHAHAGRARWSRSSFSPSSC